MAVQSEGAGPGIVLTYQFFMSATLADWKKNLGWWQTYIETQRRAGKFSNAQVAAIWKRYDSLLVAAVEAAKKNGAVSQPVPSMIGVIYDITPPPVPPGSEWWKDSKVIAIGGGLLLFILLLSGRR